MVEGHGSRDFAAPRLMAYEQPELFERLIALLIDATVIYLGAQIEAGAEAVMLFDSWAGLLPPSEFNRRHVIQAHTGYRCGAQGHDIRPVPLIGFPRLAGMLVGEYAAVTGVAGVGLDTSMLVEVAGRSIPSGVAVQGNLDPLALVAGGAALRRESAAILAAMKGRSAIFNLGHGIVPQTPPEHVAELVELVRAA